MKKLMMFGLAAFLMLGTAGCSDEEASSGEGGSGGSYGDNDRPMPEGGWTASLIPGMATDVDIPYGGMTNLKVQLISIEAQTSGEGLYGETISWGIESGSDFVSVTAQESVTSDNGFSTMMVRGKSQTGESYIVASSPKAPKTVRFHVNVLDRPVGDLNVQTSYNGLASIETYGIKLFDGADVACGMVDLKSGIDAQPLETAGGSSAYFQKLSLDQKYAVVAYGFSKNGSPVAVGCVDSNIRIEADKATTVVVPLETIDLDPVSIYTTRSIFDLGDVISALGSFGKYVIMVTDFVDNPGSFLYDKVWQLVNSWIGGLGTVAKTVIDFFDWDKDLVSWMNGVLKGNSTFCQVAQFGCQLRTLTRTMEFVGELNLEKHGAVALSGYNAYNGLAVYWRIGCAANDLNCGRYEVKTSDIGLANSTYFLEGKWDGSLANGYDKIAIETHELKLEYGKIAMYLINYVVLPKLANGAHSFDEALQVWVNCTAVGKKIHDMIAGISIAGWHPTDGPGADKAAGWCRTAVSGLGTVLNFTEAWAELKSTGSDIKIAGTAYLQDTNGDNIVDDIINGKWDGSMSVKTKDSEGNSTIKSTAVKGLWSAYNSKNIEVESVMYCSSRNGDSCEFPVVDTSELITSALCKEYDDCVKGN